MRTLRIFLIALLGLVVGLGAGGFLAFQRSARLLKAVPASPVIVGSFYDKEEHQLVYLVLNPGAVPLQVVRHSLVFTPGEASKEAGYRLMDVPLTVPLPPFGVTQVVMKLKAETEALKPGDVVAVTLHYTHPFSPDEYAVFHTTLVSERFLEEGETQATPQSPTPTPTPGGEQ